MPALLMRMSRHWKWSAVRRIESRTWRSLLTSAATASASSPSAFNSAATRRLPARCLPSTDTLAPSRANNRAVASPMPEVAPLIQATLPASLLISSFSYRSEVRDQKSEVGDRRSEVRSDFRPLTSDLRLPSSGPALKLHRSQPCRARTFDIVGRTVSYVYNCLRRHTNLVRR